MRINVFRYINKPIDPSRLKRNLAEALIAHESKLDSTIFINTKEGAIQLKYAEIVMLELIDRKVYLFTRDRKIITDKTISEWMAVLPESLFYQCHRSYIINISHIRNILVDTIIMDVDGLKAYLTKRKHKDIKKRWMYYMEISH